MKKHVRHSILALACVLSAGHLSAQVAHTTQANVLPATEVTIEAPKTLDAFAIFPLIMVQAYTCWTKAFKANGHDLKKMLNYSEDQLKGAMRAGNPAVNKCMGSASYHKLNPTESKHLESCMNRIQKDLPPNLNTSMAFLCFEEIRPGFLQAIEALENDPLYKKIESLGSW